MLNWRRWVRPGLAVSILLTILAVVFRAGELERHLVASVGERFASDGITWANVEASGRGVTISGVAPSPESQDRARMLAASVEGVRSVIDASELLPVAAPYVWSVKREGQVVTLAGSVPSEGVRNSVLAATRRAMPEAEIHDDMKLARGATPAFGATAGFAVERIAGLAEGIVTITDGTISVSGVASTSNAYGEAREAIIKGVPGAAVTVGAVDIHPARVDPFVWSADFDGEALTLAGYVPNEVVHETLLATARGALARVPITDRMAIASGEPDGFAEAASFAVNALSRMKEGGVMLNGLTLDISGTARTVDDYEALVRGLGGDLPTGLTIVADEIVPAPISPYGFEAQRNDRDIVLTGYVPSIEDSEKLAAMIQTTLSGMSVTNRTRIASGEPKMDWIGGIKFALGELAKLKTGSVTLGDRTYAIEGEALSPELYAEILADNGRTLPASLELADAEVAPPKVSPYRFAVVRDPARVVLTGYAPDEQGRDTLRELAEKTFGELEVVDNLGFGSGAPDGFVDAVDTAMQAIERLAGGRAEIDDTTVKIVGSAYNQSAVEEIADEVESDLPETFKPDLAIITRQIGQPIDPPACRDRLQELMTTGRVQFERNKAAILSESYGLLDRAAALVARCPSAKIEVGVHTDSEGSSSRNRDLTQSRAEAVVDYLVDAGVKRERLTAVGYGETKPIADNSTAAGKTANRRVEFTVEMPNG